MSQVTRQAMADDTGTFTDGTTVDKDFVDQIYDQVDDQCHSSTNPTVKPKTITDEVVASRGSQASLTNRLAIALNDDGTLKSIAGVVTTSDYASVLHGGNWVYNDDAQIWAAGDAAAPTGYTLTGAGASVARVGTGIADTTTKVGPYSIRLTRAAADVTLYQSLLNSTSFSASGQHLKGIYIGFGCWVKTALGSAARISIDDGVTITTTSYHTGDGLWQWLSGTHLVSNSATYLRIRMEANTSAGDSYFSGPTAVPGNIAPGAWIPCPTSYREVTFKKAGVVGTGTAQDWYHPLRPWIVKDVQLGCLTAPTGQALIVDINHWNGSTYNSMFSTRPQIAASGNSGGAAPDGTTYRYRCFTACRGTGTTNAALDYDVDQVGSGTAGSDLTVWVRGMQYDRPQQGLLDVADF